jgi:hypothetical protein
VNLQNMMYLAKIKIKLFSSYTIVNVEGGWNAQSKENEREVQLFRICWVAGLCTETL